MYINQLSYIIRIKINFFKAKIKNQYIKIIKVLNIFLRQKTQFINHKNLQKIISLMKLIKDLENQNMSINKERDHLINRGYKKLKKNIIIHKLMKNY